MSAEHFVVEFLAAVRADAERLEDYGARDHADAVRRCADQLQERFQAWYLEALPIPTAAVESGYSEDRLRELVRDGHLADARAEGDGRPRVRRCDLPRRPPEPLSDVDRLEQRLLGIVP